MNLSTSIETLFRGIVRKVGDNHYRAGSTITWQAFSSSSESLDVALEFASPNSREAAHKRPTGTVFIIKQVKSAKGIAPWSQYPREAEWLFGPNTQFRVADAQRTDAEVALHRSAAEAEGWDTTGLDWILLFEV